ncbi:hypothetical protein EJ08DRAFT_699981 [Tothia fuscella]|uniref:Uncharacterized protein n=1 Tax=Tothia fuscella TaxID=1048955 RepID=A0A9P4TV25_9PEZI|nr:hypothetical protein EJ08DRAFT_699981 [Tothia fuscella]
MQQPRQAPFRPFHRRREIVILEFPTRCEDFAFVVQRGYVRRGVTLRFPTKHLEFATLVARLTSPKWAMENQDPEKMLEAQTVMRDHFVKTCTTYVGKEHNRSCTSYAGQLQKAIDTFPNLQGIQIAYGKKNSLCYWVPLCKAPELGLYHNPAPTDKTRAFDMTVKYVNTALRGSSSVIRSFRTVPAEGMSSGCIGIQGIDWSSHNLDSSRTHQVLGYITDFCYHLELHPFRRAGVLYLPGVPKVASMLLRMPHLRTLELGAGRTLLTSGLGTQTASSNFYLETIVPNLIEHNNCLPHLTHFKIQGGLVLNTLLSELLLQFKNTLQHLELSHMGTTWMGWRTFFQWASEAREMKALRKVEWEHLRESNLPGPVGAFQQVWAMRIHKVPLQTGIATLSSVRGEANDDKGTMRDELKRWSMNLLALERDD